MTDLIYAKTRELTDLVCQSEAYQAYHAALAVVKRKPALYKKLNEFRRRSLILDMQTQYEEKSSVMDDLYREYEYELNEPAVVEFLSAEQKAVRMMKAIYDQIAQTIEFDLSHLDEGDEDHE